MTFGAYLDSLKGKRVAVLGIGVSNTPLLERLAAAGLSVIACDRKNRQDLGDIVTRLEDLGVALKLGEDYLENLRADVIFRTPGLRPDAPELAAAVAAGAELTSEMEVFFRVCPCPILAVTGSDGKTTTTTLIARLLQQGGYTVHVGGNIGKPLLPEADASAPTDWAVVELSSFQLMTMETSPHIAVLTNLAPNHLDVHRDMAEYVAAKENIFRHQSTEDRAIFNADNAITAEQSTRAVASVSCFSCLKELEEGVFLRGEDIMARCQGKERMVLSVKDILLPGIHNVENYMAAIAAVEGLVPDEVIRTVAASFTGVEHRIELVRTLRGVRYYNDSIASSPTRTIAGLRAFDGQPLILIAGGYDKHIPFDTLGPEIVERVKLLILCGNTANKIRQVVVDAPGYGPGRPEILETETLAQAVNLAAQRGAKGDVVTLSPACAAFDQFKNFAERGKVFKELVYQLQ